MQLSTNNNNYFCINGCGKPVKRNGFYCKKCRPLCDGPCYMDLPPCPKTVKQPGFCCSYCRSIDICDDCNGRSITVDGSCKNCKYKCAFIGCHKYVISDNHLCDLHYKPCPTIGCQKFIKRTIDTVCYRCQCIVFGCNRPKSNAYKSDYCDTCKSAFAIFLHFYKKAVVRLPYDIIKMILCLAKYPFPKTKRNITKNRWMRIHKKQR